MVDKWYTSENTKVALITAAMPDVIYLFIIQNNTVSGTLHKTCSAMNVSFYPNQERESEAFHIHLK